jgi:nucleoside-diphosphate-sugar epimerase
MPLEGATIGVTGGTGFIGGRLVEKLVLEHGARVRALVRQPASAMRLARFPVEFVDGELTDRDAVRTTVGGCDVVFDCVHDSSSPRGRHRTATEGVRALADACLEAGVPRLVHLSSLAVYGPTPPGDLTERSPWQPLSDDYGQAKRAGERLLRQIHEERGLPVVILQPTIVYGPFGGEWTRGRVEELRSGLVPLIDGGRGRCNVVYVDDVVEAMLLAATRPDVTGQSFLISANEPITWARFYGAFEELLDANATISVSRQSLGALTREERRRARRRVRQHAVSTLRGWARDPRTIAALRNVGAVERTIETAGRRLPEGTWATIKSRVFGDDVVPPVRREAEPRVHVPGDVMTALYTSQTTVRIDKARRQLGYEPQFDFSRGMELTAAYLRWAALV